MKFFSKKIIQSALPLSILLLTACGGGGSSTATTPAAATTSDVASYIADQLAGGFVGGWSGLTTTTATAFERTLAATSTAKNYTMNYINLDLAGGTWTTNTAASTGLSLGTAGWITPASTATLVDNGDGSNITITRTGEAAVGYSVVKSGTAYTLTAASPLFSLNSNTAGLAATDANGALLTSLPPLSATICINATQVFKPIANAATGQNNYSLYLIPSATPGCTAANITTALATQPVDSFLVSTQATGNAVVPTVLLITGATTATTLNNAILGMNNSNAWAGSMTPTGSTSTRKNKAAINAELTSNGYAVLP